MVRVNDYNQKSQALLASSLIKEFESRNTIMTIAVGDSMGIKWITVDSAH